MDLNQILISKIKEFFPNGKEEKGEWWTLNPFRNDTKLGSFSINLNTGLWKDFADNSKGNMPTLISQMKGISVKELSSEYNCLAEKQKSFYIPGLGSPINIYKYYTVQGIEVGQVLRYKSPDPKKGKEIRCYSNGKWTKEGFPKPHPLYNCHKLKLGKKIIIVEGEKTAEFVQKLLGDEFIVICWLGGTGQVQLSDWNLLRGYFEIYLCPDNDDVGIKAMQFICDKLVTAESASHEQLHIKLVDIKALAARYNLPQGWDLADSDDSWTKERVLKIFEETKEVIIAKEEVKPDQNISTLFCGLDEYGEEWIFESPKKRPALLRDKSGNLVIPQGKVGLLVAAGGTGKSQLTMQLVASLSTNRDFLGLFVAGESTGKIAYISGEEDKEEIKHRFQSIAEQLEFTTEERLQLIKNVSVLPLSTIHCSFSEESTSFQNQLLDTLNQKAPENGWRLIILDPASRFLTKDAEVDNKEATNFICECEKFTKIKGNPTVLITHHVNKSSLSGAKMFSSDMDSNQGASRGSSALVDGSRFVINIDTIIKEDWLKSTEFENKKLLKINHTKMNYGPFMQEIIAVVENDGVIFPLGPDTENELKKARAFFNIDGNKKIKAKSSCQDSGSYI